MPKLPVADLPPDPFFSGAGLDRADLLRIQPDELARLARSEAARELQWGSGFPALSPNGRLEWAPVRSPDIFLGFDAGQPRFTPVVANGSDPRAGLSALAILDSNDAPIFAAALSLSGWHSRHRFCANCGAASEPVRGGWSRRCPVCSAEHFPRVDPVVIMLAEHDDRVLLGRQPHYPPGRYSALAGFVEVGETIEAAVARELMEEAGLSASKVHYVASQPWPFPSSLMIGCHAAVADDALTIDFTELEDARWFSRKEVNTAMAANSSSPFQPPPPAAIAHTLLRRWLAA